MNKKTILAITPIVLLLFMSVALAIPQPPQYSPVIKKPILGAETVIQPGQNYSKLFLHPFSTDTALPIELRQTYIDECSVIGNYSDGNCYYVYRCYYVAKPGCENLSCATKSDCSLVTFVPNSANNTIIGRETTNNVGNTVEFTTSGLGEKFGVVAFISTVKMSYNIATSSWTSTPVLQNSTVQTDIVTVPGAPVPPILNVISDILNIIMSAIIALFRGLIGQATLG